MMSMNTTPWQKLLANAITSVPELFEILELNQELLPAALMAAKLFPLRVPRDYLNRIRKGDIHDPLLHQILPLQAETMVVPGYSTDPVGDNAANKVPGLLHKYHGRVLLTASRACAINCRYCFRRDFPYEKNNPGSKGWEQALNYIAADNTLEEVILSGGDPLTNNDNVLQSLLNRLAEIPHVERLRIHTRLPIVLPQRIDDTLIKCITSTRLQPIIVLHINHANEIDSTVSEMLEKLIAAKIFLYNQSVLLKGVNDDLEILIALQKKLFAHHIQPYYLHMLDKVQGAAHFAVPEATALMLYQQLQESLPGYLVPHLVREESSKPHKTRL
jgi:EF-P beta-lysylation protein EpmB